MREGRISLRPPLDAAVMMLDDDVIEVGEVEVNLAPALLAGRWWRMTRPWELERSCFAYQELPKATAGTHAGTGKSDTLTHHSEADRDLGTRT